MKAGPGPASIWKEKFGTSLELKYCWGFKVGEFYKISLSCSCCDSFGVDDMVELNYGELSHVLDSIQLQRLHLMAPMCKWSSSTNNLNTIRK